jgi:hypothetical protein
MDEEEKRIDREETLKYKAFRLINKHFQGLLKLEQKFR